MKHHWFRDYWPWWVGLFWFIGYEIFSIIAPRLGMTNLPPEIVTLSRLVWRAYAVSPWIQWIVMAVCLVLLVHFFVRRGSPYPLALLVMGVMLLGVYLARRWLI